jgi:phosphate transport system permease protein
MNRLLKDKAAEKSMGALTACSGLLLFIMVAALLYKSWPILTSKPLADLLLGRNWSPLRGVFGFLPFIMGTLWVTGVSVIIAVPLCLLTSIFLSEYSPAWLKDLARPPIDLLAGIPSVVYGVWGVMVVVPFIKNHVGPLFQSSTTGYCILAGGVVLAIMVFPVIIHISLEVLTTVKFEVREVSLALGATRWQTVKHVVLRKALPGIIAAVVLGLSRAFGETMAVLMVTGNVARLPRSVLDPAYTLPALIANNYGEMLSIPLYDSALLFASFILLLVTLVFNIISQGILARLERRLA